VFGMVGMSPGMIVLRASMSRHQPTSTTLADQHTNPPAKPGSIRRRRPLATDGVVMLES
jgi:hypothetical protein